VSPAESLVHSSTVPQWAIASLSQAPYVVVRRIVHPSPLLGVGVRGASREQRWAGFVHVDSVRKQISPFQLRISDTISAQRISSIPSLEQLCKLQRIWEHIGYKWGPGGSAGFELASGHPVTTADSDLDIIIYVDVAFSRADARSIFNSAKLAAPNSDILVETPHAAFALAEYVCNADGQMLLRCATGPRLGVDPWSEPSAELAPKTEERSVQIK